MSADESVIQYMEFDPTVLSPKQLDWCEERDPHGDLEEIALIGITSRGIASLMFAYHNERPITFYLRPDATLVGVDR